VARDEAVFEEAMKQIIIIIMSQKTALLGTAHILTSHYSEWY